VIGEQETIRMPSGVKSQSKGVTTDSPTTTLAMVSKPWTEDGIALMDRELDPYIFIPMWSSPLENGRR